MKMVLSLVAGTTFLHAVCTLNHHIQHPVIDDRLTRMRQRDCVSSDFRRYVREISQLMVPSVTANLLTLPVEVEEKVKSLNEVNDAEVEITFDPPWTQDLMSEEAKLELGFL